MDKQFINTHDTYLSRAVLIVSAVLAYRTRVLEVLGVIFLKQSTKKSLICYYPTD